MIGGKEDASIRSRIRFWEAATVPNRVILNLKPRVGLVVKL